MAPIHPHQHDDDLDLTGLSPRHRAAFLHGVSGADDGDDPAAPADGGAGAGGEAPAPDPAAPPAEPPAEGGDAPAGDGAGEGGDGADGGDAPPSDPQASIPVLPANLSEASIADLQGLHAEITTARAALLEGVTTMAHIEAVEEATRRMQAIVAEVQRRMAEAADVRQRAQAVADAIATEDAAFPEVGDLVLASATPAPPTAAQVAALRGEQPPAAQNPAPAAPARTRPRTAMVANVGGDFTHVGQTVSDAELGDLLDRAKMSETRSIVAALPPYMAMPEFANGDIPLLGTGSPEQNSQMMRDTRDAFARAQRGETLEAMVAAICEPLDILRDIPDAFNVAEPIRAIFPSRPASRLGFQFFRSVGLADVVGAVNLWDEADQAAVSRSNQATWKPCLEIDCPTATSIKAEAIVACLLWDNTMEMSNPENLANLRNALNALRARTKEGRILQLVDANSSHYTHGGDYGAAAVLIEALNNAMTFGGYTNRLDDETYTAILPPGAVAVLMNDLSSRGFEGFAVTDALAYVRDRVFGVGRVVMSLDASLAGEPSLPFPAVNPVGNPAVPLPSLNDTYRVRLLDPTAALYSETGQLNMGTSTDSSLLLMNKTQFFQEEYLFLAKQGPQPWFAIDVDLCANGARAGWVTPTECDFS